MTKPIIIDGVNVSGCYFLSTGVTNITCKNQEEIDEECKYNPNCYYKQLQRKTIECERLKSELEPETGTSYKNQDKLQIATEALREIWKLWTTPTPWVNPSLSNRMYTAIQIIQQTFEQIGAEADYYNLA